MARAPVPQQIETPAMRRSAMLARMLEEGRQPRQITGGGGELAARLLGQGITQFASNRADKRAAEESEAQRQARMQAMAQILGLGGGAEPNQMADALSPPPVEAMQPPMPAGPAPIAPVEGGPLPPVGQMPPPQPMAQPAPPTPGMGGPAPMPQAAPQAQPQQQGIFNLAPNERQLAQALVASGDEQGLAALLESVQKRNVSPNIQVGPDGRPFNANDPASLDMRFADRTVERGFVIDRNNPDNEGRYIPEIGQGMEPVYDRNGNVVGVRNIEGSVDSEAARVRAVEDARNASGASYAGVRAGAEAAGRAPYQLERVEGPQGQTITGSLADILGQGPIAGPGIVERGEMEKSIGAAGRQEQTARAGGTVIQDLNRALEIVQRGGPLNVGPISGIASAVPGTPAWEVKQFVESALSNVGLDTLQTMRENSPTGGALGQVPIQQQRRLEQVLGSLGERQRPEVLEDNLKRVSNIYMDIVYGSPAELRTMRDSGQLSEEDYRRYARRETLSFDEFGRSTRRSNQPAPRNAPPQSAPRQPAPARPSTPPRTNGQTRRYNPNTGRLE